MLFRSTKTIWKKNTTFTPKTVMSSMCFESGTFSFVGISIAFGVSFGAFFLVKGKFNFDVLVGLFFLPVSPSLYGMIATFLADVGETETVSNSVIFQCC